VAAQLHEFGNRYVAAKAQVDVAEHGLCVLGISGLGRVTLRQAKQCGIQTSINVVRISAIDFPTLSTLSTLVSKVDACRDAIDVIYFADSNGNLTPDSVNEIAEEIKRGTSAGLGFHAHDNMGLAMANSIAAVKQVAHFIDASLLGMGKGIGNLRLEKWTAYLLIKNILGFETSPFRGIEFIWERGNLFQIRSERGVD